MTMKSVIGRLCHHQSTICVLVDGFEVGSADGQEKPLGLNVGGDEGIKLGLCHCLIVILDVSMGSTKILLQNKHMKQTQVKRM